MIQATMIVEAKASAASLSPIATISGPSWFARFGSIQEAIAGKADCESFSELVNKTETIEIPTELATC